MLGKPQRTPRAYAGMTRVKQKKKKGGGSHKIGSVKARNPGKNIIMQRPTISGDVDDLRVNQGRNAHTDAKTRANLFRKTGRASEGHLIAGKRKGRSRGMKRFHEHKQLWNKKGLPETELRCKTGRMGKRQNDAPEEKKPRESWERVARKHQMLLNSRTQHTIRHEKNGDKRRRRPLGKEITQLKRKQGTKESALSSGEGTEAIGKSLPVVTTQIRYGSQGNLRARKKVSVG